MGTLYIHKDNTVFEGEFANDKMNGEGKLYRPNGCVVKGYFRNDAMEGAVEIVDENFPKKKLENKINEIKNSNF